MTDQITGGQLVVRMLESLGVRHVFGVPGGQTLAITDAIIDSPLIHFVTARHENAAAVMADAYGRLTGTPGVCIATTGPGATNLITGVGGAFRDSSPCLIITCNNNGENIHKDDAQNADHVELFKPLTKYSRLVAHGTSIVQAMEEAYINAMTGNPGPAHLDFARDTIEGDVTDAPTLPDVHPLLSWVNQRPEPDRGALAELISRVAEAERPVIWLGNGANRSGAGSDALAVAEALQIPVVTTFNGIGSVPTDHPLVFGSLSRMGTSLSTRVVAESDLVLAVGNSLNAVSTGRWQLKLPAIIQIDVDPSMLGRYYAGQTTGIVSDARVALEALRNGLDSRSAELSSGRADWIASLRSARDEWRAQNAVIDGAAAGTVSPADVVRRLRDVAPDNTILIADAGNPGIWSFLWDIRDTGTYLKPVGFGNMGFAVPAAVAASTIDPNRPILVLVGDGSLGMTLAELETIVRVGGRVVVVVLNDAGYGNIRQEQTLHFRRTIGVDFGPSNFATVAQGLGLTAERITDLEKLAERVSEAFKGTSPILLDVPIDPEVSAWTYPAFRPYDAQKV